MLCLILISFLLYGVSCSVEEEEDEEKYIIFNGENNCVIGIIGCNSTMLQEKFIFEHNYRRRFIAEVGLVASNMLKMEWDQTLANRAQQYVETCFVDYPVYVRLEVCREASAVTTFDGGVNYLRKIYDEEYPTVEDRIANAIADWFEYFISYDIEKLNFIHFYHANGTAEDAWSQVVRATTWKVGCALADGPTGNSGLNEFIEVIACFYANTKLQKGEEVFKPGEPCSSCPLGTHCDASLCEVEPGQCPVPGNNYKLNEDDCPAATDVVDSEQSREILWECDLQKYGEQCEVEHPCSPIWNVDLSGYFKTIMVKGDCVSANVFKKEIRVEVPSCFRFQYIKEGNQMQPFHSMVMGFAFNLNSGESSQVTKNEDANNWTDVNLDVPWTGAAIQVGILVRSRSDNFRQQEIIVRNFSVLEGSCA